MSDHEGQIILPLTATRGLVFISAFILLSLAYDDVDVMDDDNIVTALSI